MDFTITIQKINQAVNQASNILLVIHQRPDADALGSLIVFSDWLDILGKNYTSFCREVLNSDTSLLTNPALLRTNPEEILGQQYDLVIVFDSGDLKHAGLDDILPQLSPLPLIINIDHHVTNKNFGDINLVNLEAVSTTEILYHFFVQLKIDISPQVATALLAGIIYDTYSFTNPNTTYTCLDIASQLLSAGAKMTEVTDLILKNKTVDILKLWGKILFRLNHHPQFNIVTTVITAQDLPNQKGQREVTEGIANFLNNLAEVNVVLILQQQADGIIKGSLRTNNDLIDAAKLARILGGGGHRKAAGFKVKGELVKTTEGRWQIR